MIGGYVENIDGISYGSYIVPGLLMLTLLTQSISNTSFGIFFPKFNGTIYEILAAPISTLEIVLAFVGAGALGHWSKMAGNSGFAGSNGWTVSLGDMKRDGLGFNYRTLETPHGMLQLIPTPALRGPYNKYMLVVDDDNLFHSQYRAPMYQTNIEVGNSTSLSRNVCWVVGSTKLPTFAKKDNCFSSYIFLRNGILWCRPYLVQACPSTSMGNNSSRDLFNAAMPR